MIISISITTIALSVIIMILASSILKGFKTEISNKIFGLWGHIHINTPSLSSVIDPKAIDINQDFYPHLDTVAYLQQEVSYKLFGKELPWTKIERTKGGIQKVYPYVQAAGIIVENDQLEGVLLKGVDINYNWEKFREYLQEGDIIQYNDSIASRDIIISRLTADRLQLEIADRFQINFVKGEERNRRVFSVAGIYSTGMEEYDKKLAFVDMKMAQFMSGLDSNEITGFEIFVDHIEDLEVINEFVYYDNLPPDLYSQTIKQKYPNIFDWLELQNMNEYLILGLLLVICVINMITVLLILILERTKMIGILKAMGSTNWQIRKIFLIQAGRMILWGLLIGNAVGIGMAWLQKQFKLIKLNEQDYYVPYAPVDIEPWMIVFINTMLIIVILITLILPSAIITRITPIKSIRFD